MVRNVPVGGRPRRTALTEERRKYVSGRSFLANAEPPRHTGAAAYPPRETREALGVRIGNWLSVDEARALLRRSPSDGLCGKRDRAILAVLVGCGLRRAELVGLRVEDFQIREKHCVICGFDRQRKAHPYSPGPGVGKADG
jgi:integrase